MYINTFSYIYTHKLQFYPADYVFCFANKEHYSVNKYEGAMKSTLCTWTSVSDNEGGRLHTLKDFLLQNSYKMNKTDFERYWWVQKK